MVDQREVTSLCRDVITLLDHAAATEQRVTLAKLTDAWYGKGPTGLRVSANVFLYFISLITIVHKGSSI